MNDTKAFERRFGKNHRVLGEGENGAVFSTTIPDVVIKQGDLINLANEICVLSTVSSIPFVVPMLGYRVDGKTFETSIAYRRMAGDVTNIKFVLQNITDMMWDVSRGLAGIHNHNVAHFDVKLPNILYDSACNYYLGDLGAGHPGICAGETKVREIVTPDVRPPEAWLQLPLGFSVDVWSLGITFVLAHRIEANIVNPPDIFNLRRPLLPQLFEIFGLPTEANWPGVTNSRIYQDQVLPNVTALTPTLEQARRRFKSMLQETTNMTPVAIDLALKMLEVNPNRRYTIFEVLEHEYFDQIRESDTRIAAISCMDSLRRNQVVVSVQNSRRWIEFRVWMWYFTRKQRQSIKVFASAVAILSTKVAERPRTAEIAGAHALASLCHNDFGKKPYYTYMHKLISSSDSGSQKHVLTEVVKYLYASPRSPFRSTAIDFILRKTSSMDLTVASLSQNVVCLMLIAGVDSSIGGPEGIADMAYALVTSDNNIKDPVLLQQLFSIRSIVAEDLFAPTYTFLESK
jgi:serine/threonine protein kinase